MTTDALLHLLQQIGIQKLKVRGHNIVGCCPAHTERRPSWGIRTDVPHMHGCFTCGFKGSLALLLTRTYNWSKAEAENLLGAADVSEKLGREPFRLLELSEQQNPVPPSNLFPFVRSIKGRTYLYGRGLSEQTIQKARVLFDREQDRIIFPWFIQGVLYGCTGRRRLDTDETVPKIVAYYGLKKGRHFYLPSGGRLQSSTPVVLVEGEIDALKVYQSGFPNVAALSFGRFSETQRDLLIEASPPKVILFFDNDRTGLRLTQDVTSTLNNHFPVTAVNYGLNSSHGKTDPGALTCETIRRLVNSSAKATGRSLPTLSL